MLQNGVVMSSSRWTVNVSHLLGGGNLVGASLSLPWEIAEKYEGYKDYHHTRDADQCSETSPVLAFWKVICIGGVPKHNSIPLQKPVSGRGHFSYGCFFCHWVKLWERNLGWPVKAQGHLAGTHSVDHTYYGDAELWAYGQKRTTRICCTKSASTSRHSQFAVGAMFFPVTLAKIPCSDRRESGQRSLTFQGVCAGGEGRFHRNSLYFPGTLA